MKPWRTILAVTGLAATACDRLAAVEGGADPTFVRLWNRVYWYEFTG